LTEQDIREKFRKKKIVILKTSPLRKKVDVAGAKMLKAFHFIEQNIVFNGFKIIESDMLWHGKNHSLFYYSIENDILSKTMELKGPPLKTLKHVSLFKKKHKKTFIKGKRLFALEKRKFNDVKVLVKNIIKITNVKDNVSNIKLI